MKAWVLNSVGNIEFSDVDIADKPGEGHVLIKVKAAGICGSDIPRIYKDGAHNMPLIPGHEFSGMVDEIGTGVSADLKGKRVGIFPLIPCGKCSACRAQKYEMCHNYNYLGSRTDGGFAEYVEVPEWNLIALPDKVSYEQAAMLEPMAVAVHAMRQFDPTENDKVVICGLGTIGLLLAMFLHDAGVKNVYAIGNKAYQKNEFSKLGFPEENFINAADIKSLTDEVMLKTGGCGADIYYDCVGSLRTITQSVNLVKEGGGVCLVGNPKSDISFDKNDYWKILRRQLTIKGTWNSSFLGNDENAETDDWHYVLERLSAGKVAPENFISHKLKLADLRTGLEIMRDKTEGYTKIMVIN